MLVFSGMHMGRFEAHYKVCFHSYSGGRWYILDVIDGFLAYDFINSSCGSFSFVEVGRGKKRVVAYVAVWEEEDDTMYMIEVHNGLVSVFYNLRYEDGQSVLIDSLLIGKVSMVKGKNAVLVIREVGRPDSVWFGEDTVCLDVSWDIRSLASRRCWGCKEECEVSEERCYRCYVWCMKMAMDYIECLSCNLWSYSSPRGELVFACGMFHKVYYEDRR